MLLWPWKLQRGRAKQEAEVWGNYAMATRHWPHDTGHDGSCRPQSVSMPTAQASPRSERRAVSPRPFTTAAPTRHSHHHRAAPETAGRDCCYRGFHGGGRKRQLLYNLLKRVRECTCAYGVQREGERKRTYLLPQGTRSPATVLAAAALSRLAAGLSPLQVRLVQSHSA